MHCNLMPPEPCQPIPALITMPYQVWSRWTYPLPYYSIFAADTLLYAVTFTFDLWPWTFAAYRLWRDEDVQNLNAINRAIRGGVIAISVFDLMTLNIALCVALGSGIIFTKFDLRLLLRAWIITFFDADTLWHAVTLTSHSLTLKVRGTQESRQSLYEIWAKSSNPRLHYW